MASFLFSLCLFLSLSVSTLAQEDGSTCPLLGPDFPKPTHPAGDQAVMEAQQLMTSAIQQALSTSIADGGLDSNSTSFSLQVYSLHEAAPLFTYHYSAPALSKPVEGVASVDSNTIYRLGSVSKLWTVYVYLIAAGDTSFNEPITKYVPELAHYAEMNANSLATDSIDKVNWNDITVGALASQLAGLGRDVLPPSFEQRFTAFGLPPVPPSNTSFSFFDAFLSRHPNVAPFSTPSYSNPAFTILMFALEKITGHSLSDLLTSELIEPLGLNSSSCAQPASSERSLVPFNASASSYNLDLFDLAPSGGFYSSLNALTKVGRSILNSTFLTPAMTRKCMKPATFTSNANYSVGTPWEIIRAPGDRNSHLYTKSGGMGLYSAEFVLMPDYDVGFNVLAAGPASGTYINRLSDLISEIFYPALEAAAKAEADCTYAGTFRDPSGLNSSITVITDSRPGLGLQQWIFNGTDITSAFASQLLPFLPSPPKGAKIVARLYPTGLQTAKDGQLTRTAFRAGFGTLSFMVHCRSDHLWEYRLGRVRFQSRPGWEGGQRGAESVAADSSADC